MSRGRVERIVQGIAYLVLRDSNGNTVHARAGIDKLPVCDVDEGDELTIETTGDPVFTVSPEECES